MAQYSLCHEHGVISFWISLSEGFRETKEHWLCHVSLFPTNPHSVVPQAYVGMEMAWQLLLMKMVSDKFL